MTAQEYIAKALAQGLLTHAHIEQLTRHYQAAEGLVVDGFPGPATRERLESHSSDYGIECWPLRMLPDGRRPVVTSAFRTHDRPKHDGVDLVYHYLTSDPEMPRGDGGAVIKDGERKWWIPPGTVAIAAGAGRIAASLGSPTGMKIWIDHGRGWRTGYFHLRDLRVRPGQDVGAGHELGTVGDNPIAFDIVHLHFELSPVSVYRPTDPWLALKSAPVIF